MDAQAHASGAGDCGLVDELEPLVSRGRNASVREVPWHVGVYALLFVEMLICGGSLVRANVVVTAAHCFDHLPHKHLSSGVAVTAGNLNRPIADSVDVTQQRQQVNRILVPETYDSAWTNYQDDLAILILQEPFTFNSFVRAICLDFEKNLENLQLRPGNKDVADSGSHDTRYPSVGPEEIYVPVVGWGITEKNKPSRTLKVVELPYISLAQCRELSDNRQYLTSDKICAGYTNGTAAVCRGDSGGGLAFPRRDGQRDRYYLRGVVSVALKPRELDRACNLHVHAMFTRLGAPQHQLFLTEILQDVNGHRQGLETCPPIQPSYVPAKTTQVAWNKCIEYQAKLVYPCAETAPGAPTRQNYCYHDYSPQTVGEDKYAGVGEHPYMVMLTTSREPTTTGGRFPGTILSEKFILTSAWRVTYDNITWARLRAHHKSWSPTERDLYRVARSIPHPKWKYSDDYHDIALLETDRAMELDHLAVPACLDTRRGVSYERVMYTRWSHDGEPKKITLEALPASTCVAYHEKRLSRGYEEASMMCYGPGSCEYGFYYGAPIVVRNSQFGCMATVVGVTNHYGCVGGPNLYTRVAHYREWIERHVWGA